MGLPAGPGTYVLLMASDQDRKIRSEAWKLPSASRATTPYVGSAFGSGRQAARMPLGRYTGRDAGGLFTDAGLRGLELPVRFRTSLASKARPSITFFDGCSELRRRTMGRSGG